jgi:hypothetical protein
MSDTGDIPTSTERACKALTNAPLLTELAGNASNLTTAE